MSDHYLGVPSNPAIASIASPSLTEGRQVKLSTDLTGALRVTGLAVIGGAVTLADGADVAEGSTTDAAVATDATGTVNAHIRGLVKLLAACISIGSNWMMVSIQNATLAVTQSGAWSVTTTPTGAAAVLSNQVAVTASAVALASNPCKQVTVKALVGNTIAVYIGPAGISTATGYELIAGDSITVAVSNTNLLHLIASTTGASISWIAVN